MTRRRVSPSRWVLIALLSLLAVAVAFYAVTRDAQQVAETKTTEAEVEGAKADAAENTLDAICDAGDRAACRLLDQLDQVDVTEPQDVEIQEPEVQEPELQEPEFPDREQQDPDPNDADPNDPESQDVEQQDAETQDNEVQDSEVDDPDKDDAETQDEEVQNDEQQDPEIDDPEVQDPEHDDPDPNSMVTFAAADNCSPPAGEVVVDVDLALLRDPDARTVTYVLTCKSVPFASFLPGSGHMTQ